MKNYYQDKDVFLIENNIRSYSKTANLMEVF